MTTITSNTIMSGNYHSSISVNYSQRPTVQIVKNPAHAQILQQMVTTLSGMAQQSSPSWTSSAFCVEFKPTLGAPVSPKDMHI